jgi:pimeloyl-ACP methyl ester carboxylesterase
MSAFRLFAILAFVAGCFATAPSKARPAPSADRRITYNTVNIGGLNIFYREAGPRTAPVILLLHGFPSSSRMFETLMPLLADRYRLVAPDYPGFGYSDAPAPEKFSYSFDSVAQVINSFTQALHLDRYTLYMQDYGGPVGYRLAVSHPERITGIIVQNAIAHEEGLGRLQAARKGFWADRAANESKYRAGLGSLQTARLRHVGGSPHPERYNPDLWHEEFAFLTRPGEAAIQSELFYDYRNNLAAFPAWQSWLRERQPATLVVWGRNDPVFDIAETAALKKDLPKAEVHILEAGHFALDESADEIAGLVRRFMQRFASHRAK